MSVRRSRRRKRQNGLKPIFVILLSIILLSAAAFAVRYFFYYRTAQAFSSAKAPDGTVKALAVHTDSQSEFAQKTSTAEQQKYIDDAIDFAIDSGINAVFVDVIQQEEENTTVFYRDRSFKAYQSIAQNDSFLNYFTRFDPLEYMCRSASDADISVYAVADDIFKDDEKALKSFDRMKKKYAIAGLYFKEPADTALGILTNADGEQIVYTADGAWDTASPDLFAQSVRADFKGAVIDNIEKARDNPEIFGMMLSCLASSSQEYALVNYTPVTALGVTYPEDGEEMYSSECFVMGTSDPSSPLLLNGAEIVRTSEDGLFGTLVTLAEGENTLEFTNGANTLSYKITRIVLEPAEPSKSKEMPHDETQEVEAGTAVRVNKTIAGVLYDPSNDGYISETVRSGATARVVSCAETVRGGKKTWAYQLDSGDYVLASNTEKMSGDYKDTVFTGAAAVPTETGETITFEGDGQPLMYSNTKENSLVLHIYNASAAADFKISGSKMVTGTQTVQNEKYTELVLNFAAPLWGYTVTYSGEKTVLYLNNTPSVSENTEKPLENVSVMLDAGHGGNDSGAVGTAGVEAPMEKDVNLAVAKAAKTRLEQLGAKVTMTREDDTFSSIADRNNMITSVQPDYFIAIHHNSIDLTVNANDSKGTECYYFYENSKGLAENLVNRVTSASGRESRGTAWGYYYVTRNTTARAVLLECGFMVNPAEYGNVTDNNIIWREGYAIAQAVYDNLANNQK